MMSTPLPLTTLIFDIPLKPSGITSFRGLIAELVGWEHDLFHNHADGKADRHRYRFPLIQYKIKQKKAAIFGMGLGAETLRSFIDPQGVTFAGKIPIAERRDENFRLGMADKMLDYRIKDWLPINQENYGVWHELKSQEDILMRIQELERILAAHLLAFAQGVNFTVPRPRGLEVKIDRFYGPRQVKAHHRMPLEAYDARFSCNLCIPPGVGIGKSASLGFGMVLRDTQTSHSRAAQRPGDLVL